VPSQISTGGRGPLGVPTNSPTSDLGTSARIRNRAHVPLGVADVPLPNDGQPRLRIGGSREHRTVQLPQLQIGSRGKHVQRLQRLLNSRLDSDTDLKVDGIFGPKTRAAVIDLQRDSDLRPDAIVGRKTWFALITAEQKEATSKPKPAPTSAAAPSSGTGIATTGPGPVPEAAPRFAVAPPAERSVDEWSLDERFEYVLLHTGAHLKVNIRAQFAALLTSTGLKYIVGSLAVLGACQFIGIGEVLDGILLLWAGFSAGRCLAAFVLLTCTASTKPELEDAANDLAQAIEILGVLAFFSLLSRVARALRARINAGEEGGAPPEDEAGGQKPAGKPEKQQTEAKSSKEESAPIEDPIARRRALNQSLRNSPQFEKDLAKAKVTREQLQWMDQKKAPLGFKSPEQFDAFQNDLSEALRQDGLDDAQVGMKGTATTFYSENPGKPPGHFWDADPTHPGDYDLNLASDKMAQQMQQQGVQVSPTYGIYKTRDINSQFPAVSDFSAKWSGILGRDVNVVGYPADTVPVRDTTEFTLVK
jgi:putative peptidoglycan binding protein